MEDWTMKRTKNWNCELTATGSCHASNAELESVEAFINGRLFDLQLAESAETSAQREVESSFWNYIDSLDCRAAADAIAENVTVMAFYG
jgi:hypothetical protein